MTDSPPSDDGAVQLTVAWPSPDSAVTSVGAVGTVDGTMTPDGTEGGLFPALFTATTVNA